MWYAGIDWADDHHDAVVIDEAGQRVASCRVTHTPEGLGQLVTFLQGTVGSAATPQELACLLETTHGLLIAALTPPLGRTALNHQQPGRPGRSRA